MALRGLASNLSYPGRHGLRSALLCCQIFISIKQVRRNHAAMAQHIVRGLRMMREYGARPRFALAGVFIIKLFAAPCKFADALPAYDGSGTTLSLVSIATSTLEFLCKLVHVATLLSVSFLRLFHLILKILLLGALDSSPDLEAEVQIESGRLQAVAEDAGESARTYITCDGTGATKS
ncbi:hypothetical protein CGRA01v4_09914 [Colletotrichum graminicola]|nr:hypothetical protein CGRA01v4_09914 [Colletotrichum graminicola]